MLLHSSMPKKYKINEIIEIAESKGCRLLSKEYIGNAFNLEFECSCGNAFFKPLTNFKKYPKCKNCYWQSMAQKNRYSYAEVYDYFLKNDCVLLEKEYSHSQKSLRYRCKCGNESKIIFNSFIQGTRCKECGKKKMWEKRRPTIEFISQQFKDKNCFLLATEYKNSSTPMPYICQCGLESKICWSNFQQGSRCRNCCGKPKITIEFLQEYFIENDCELISKEYKSNTTLLDYRCSCGTLSKTKWIHFRQGCRCQKCKITKISGSNSPSWNPNRTNEDRLNRRQYPEYNAWRKSVFERDNYTCQACKKRGGYLIAHHKNSFIANPEQRTLLENGSTLCQNCHNDFHSKYTVKNNTEQQFEEYLKTK